MELYIVRHGRTEWNAKGLIQGISDIPLLEEGREMARQTARGLKTVSLDAVYASPLSRAFETAEILVEGRNLEIRKDQRLREMDFGIYEGEDYVRDSELLRGFYDAPDRYQAPEGGESFYDVEKRTSDFLNEIRKIHGDGERILIVKRKPRAMPVVPKSL